MFTGLAILGGSVAEAQCELARVADLAGASGDEFGFALDVSGARAVVAAPNDDDAGTDAGAVFVYDLVGGVWVESAKILAADAASFDRFGTSVALEGDLLVVGTPQDDDGGFFDSGSVYVYELDGGVWVERTKLNAFDANLGNYFGIDVDVVGGRLVVGACQLAQFEVFGTGEGRAYVYTGAGATWTLEQQLFASDPDDGDRFGVGVDLDASGTRLLIGAENDDEAATDAGAAYVFDFEAGSWGESQKLIASDAGGGDFGGIAVALDGDVAVLGAPLHQTLGIRPGAAYVFETDGTSWSETGKLLAAAAVDEDRAGISVQLEDDLVLVGAYAQTDLTPGLVRSFTRAPGGGWVEGTTLAAADGVDGDAFGYNVALDGTRVFVGARDDDGQGSAYEFLWSPARTTQRDGGSNPASLAALSEPILGSVLTLQVDVGSTGHALGGVVGYASPLTFPLGGGQTLLVNVADPAGELLSQGLLGGPLASWDLGLPADVAFCGFPLSVQGLHVGGVQPFALSNALDFEVGL